MAKPKLYVFENSTFWYTTLQFNFVDYKKEKKNTVRNIYIYVEKEIDANGMREKLQLQ